MVNRLALVPGQAPQFGVFYWEPAVDGRLLRELVTLGPEDEALDTASLGPVGHNVPALVHSWPAGLLDDALVWLGERPSELPDGRIHLYVCPVCGDLGCGAVTATVDRTPRTVVWRDFGWDVNYTIDDDDDEVRYDGGPFEFDRDQYDHELRRFIDTFESVRQSLPPVAPTMPRSEMRGRRRRHRWPFSPK